MTFGPAGRGIAGAQRGFLQGLSEHGYVHASNRAENLPQTARHVERFAAPAGASGLRVDGEAARDRAA